MNSNKTTQDSLCAVYENVLQADAAKEREADRKLAARKAISEWFAQYLNGTDGVVKDLCDTLNRNIRALRSAGYFGSDEQKKLKADGSPYAKKSIAGYNIELVTKVIKTVWKNEYSELTDTIIKGTTSLSFGPVIENITTERDKIRKACHQIGLYESTTDRLMMVLEKLRVWQNKKDQHLVDTAKGLMVAREEEKACHDTNNIKEAIAEYAAKHGITAEQMKEMIVEKMANQPEKKAISH